MENIKEFQRNDRVKVDNCYTWDIGFRSASRVKISRSRLVLKVTHFLLWIKLRKRSCGRTPFLSALMDWAIMPD